MIKPRNTTGKVQYTKHAEHGTLIREQGRKFFRPSKLELSLCFCDFVELDSVPEDLIMLNGEHRRRDKKKFVKCIKCSEEKGAEVLYPKSEMDGDICRSCLMDYDNPYERMQLNLMNAHYKVGYGYEGRCYSPGYKFGSKATRR